VLKERNSGIFKKPKPIGKNLRGETMNREFILKNTTSFTENLLKRLQDPEFAQYYLEAALKDYEKDGDMESLLLAMRDVAEAQGGIGKLAKRTKVSREHLYDILAGKHIPRLDKVLDILSALGFRVRLERQDAICVKVQDHPSSAIKNPSV
jgi:probable addiction module antidote protein